MSQPIMVSLPGANIATFVDGDEELPWIVLSNSLGTTHVMWEPQLKLLTAHYQVLRYDTRGHGNSSAPGAAYEIDDLAEDILGIIDHYGIESADMLGLSLGGTTMMRFASLHSGRVRRLIICDASAETEPSDLERWDRRIAQVMSQGSASLGEELLSRWYTEALREERPDIMAWSRQMLAEVSADGYAGCAVALKNIGLLPDIAGLPMETLFISGAQDGTAPSKMARMSEIAPAGRFALIDPGAHFPNIESPVQFNATIANFLKS